MINRRQVGDDEVRRRDGIEMGIGEADAGWLQAISPMNISICTSPKCRIKRFDPEKFPLQNLLHKLFQHPEQIW